MLEDIKKKLLDNPDNIVHLLEKYGFANIKQHRNYISCGRDESGSPKSIVIKTENNQYLYVTDYPKNINKDIISYIIQEKGDDFKGVLGNIKSILGISNFETYFHRPSVFGGFYDNIKARNTEVALHVYDESVLDQYVRLGNRKFIKDNISLNAQEYFGIRFCVAENGIVIPIRSEVGDLIAVKMRCNYDDTEQKYFYLYPGQSSKTLYGFSQNYSELTDNTVLVFESEKSVMQCYSYGIRNAVALGSGSLSQKQAQMIISLNPSKVILLHDQGYDFNAIKRNIEQLTNYSRFSSFKVGYWDWKKGKYPEKVSPSDLGKKELNRILENEIHEV